MLMRMCQKRRDANDIFLGKYLLLPDDFEIRNRSQIALQSTQSDPETLCSHFALADLPVVKTGNNCI